MSVKSKERYWDLQSQTLNAIRSDLATPQDRYHRSPRRRGSHTLPRLDTPPEHSYRRSGSNLRDSRYEKIPPVKKNTRRNYDSPEDDSWGEEEESEEEETVYPQMMPLPYPMMVYPAPAPVAWPMTKKKRRKKRKKDKKVRYADQPTFIEDSPQYPDHYENLPYIIPDDSVLRRYQVFPQEEYIEQIPVEAMQYPYHPLEEATYHFNTDPSLSHKLVEDLIWEDMEDDLIPSVLVDVLREKDKEEEDDGDAYVSDLPKHHPLYWPAFDVCVDIVDKEMPKCIKEIVEDTIQTETQSQLGDIIRSGQVDPILDEMDSILDEVVKEEATGVARQGIRELAETHLKLSTMLGIIEEICDEIIDEDAEIVAASAIGAVSLEDMTENDIVEPVIQELSRDVARETMQYYGNEFRKKETNAIEHHAAEKLVEHICLEYLMHFVARQLQFYSPEEAAEKLLDGMMLNILLEQVSAVQKTRSSTTDNKPLRKHHEKLFTDVTTDVLLEELCKSLDEDMNDLDEYEQGLWDPATTEPPEWAKKDIG